MFRVIVCPDAVHSIIQRRICAFGRTVVARWTAESFVTNRVALTRLWEARTGTPAPAEILALPPRFSCDTNVVRS